MQPLQRSVSRAAVRRSPVPLARHKCGGPAVCVFHTARRRLWGVQLVRQGGAGCERESPALRSAGAGLCRLRIAVCARSPAVGVRGERALDSLHMQGL